ncbi:helix-turn-helix transcriptional regulator [Amycolatopsis dongchuanensis]|uniref:HTH cro/C1-type domain-containing protein n=1 Tax=Amycolatopsis dongchuanensis TaxID=1070866 RepID=A0ABP8VQU4_9PSEU
MNDQPTAVVGERVRFYRTAAHKTKTVVAGLAGITPDYLYQIERGQKLPTVAVLAQLAEVLGVEPGDLLRREPVTKRQRAEEVAANAIYRALTVRRDPPECMPPLPDVQREVLAAWRTWQTSPRRYSTLTAELPGLIADVETVVRSAELAGRRAAHGCAADLYGLLRTVTKRIGRVDLSLLAADRSIRAAEAADDPIRLAGARWNLTQVLLADSQAAEAEDVAMQSLRTSSRCATAATRTPPLCQVRFCSSQQWQRPGEVTAGPLATDCAKPYHWATGPVNGTLAGPPGSAQGLVDTSPVRLRPRLEGCHRAQVLPP